MHPSQDEELQLENSMTEMQLAVTMVMETDRWSGRLMAIKMANQSARVMDYQSMARWMGMWMEH